MSEIKEIMEIFGIKTTDGLVRGTHLAQILTYLEQKKCEDYMKTASKLSLLCGMSRRSLQENYLQGIEDFGIIDVKIVNNIKVWRWIGIKALREDLSPKVKMNIYGEKIEKNNGEKT